MSTAQSATGRAAPPGVTAAGPAQHRLGLALVVIATAQLMVVLDATIVNVALPHIQTALGFSGSGLEWVVNAYALTFGGFRLLGGRAGDILGRGRRSSSACCCSRRPRCSAGSPPRRPGCWPRASIQGGRRGDRRPGRAVPDHHHVPGRPAAQPGHGRVRGDERRRGRGRPDRPARPARPATCPGAGVLFVNVPIGIAVALSRCPRSCWAAGEPGRRRPVSPLRPARRDHRDRWPGRLGLRARPPPPPAKGGVAALGRQQGRRIAQPPPVVLLAAFLVIELRARSTR